MPWASELADQGLRYYKKKMLERHIRRVADTIGNIAHICVVPKDLLPVGGAHYVSFFNPRYIRSLTELASISANVSTFSDLTDDRPRWLFVLARFDLEFQEKKHGKQEFDEMVVSKLRQTLDNGRHPTMIGPAAFIAEVSRYFAGESGVSLLPVCAFAEFEQRLLDAEIVFYWQIFSTSTFLRLFNGLPVFFFDRGHAARLFEPLHEAGLRSYYIVDSPIYLDIEEPLSASMLTEMSGHFRQSADAICRLLANSPSPAEMVTAVMDA